MSTGSMTPESIIDEYRARFPESCEPRVCMAPGRINLLGEHVDYNGLPVLPMTLDKYVFAAYNSRPDRRIVLHNTNALYSSAEFLNSRQLIPSPWGAWENYAKAAIAGLNERLGLPGDRGMDILVSSTLPEARGLSSSSAFVIAVALAYLDVCGLELDTAVSRLDLAQWLAEAERFTGTQGGGMDQAVILLGSRNQACKINFYPLNVDRIPVFPDHMFVVCDSGVVAAKTADAKWRYNEGPLTCRLICALVERTAQQHFGKHIRIHRLIDLWREPLCLTNAEVEALFETAFPAPATTLDDAAAYLDLSATDVRNRWIGGLPQPPGGFRLQARARHQLTEHARVVAGHDAMLAADAHAFGALMYESHHSCAVDYAVSCPELDRLVEIGRASGSLGSRLTGAGFGGATIHLVARDKLDPFFDAVGRACYETGGGLPGPPRMFVAEPGVRASYV